MTSTHFLHLHLRGHSTATVFRGRVRQLARLAHRAQRLQPACRAVFSREDDYTDSQLAVLHAMADNQHDRFLADLDAGLIQEPASLV
jgi:hypothetical protein